MDLDLERWHYVSLEYHVFEYIVNIMVIWHHKSVYLLCVGHCDGVKFKMENKSPFHVSRDSKE